MKVSQLALAAALVAVLTCSASAQGPSGQGPGGGAYSAGYPGGYPGGQGYSMQGNPGMQGGYPGMPQGGYLGMQQGGYPGMQQGGYPMMQQGGYPAGQASYAQQQGDPAQEQLYGPQGGPQGGPMPMGGGQCEGGQCPGGECGGGAAPSNCYDDGLTHYAYFDTELFYARRTSGLVNQPVVETTAGGVLETTTSGPEFKYEPGVKSTVGYMFPQAFALEGTFMGQNYWSSHSTENNGAADLTIPGPLGSALVDLGTGGTTMPVVGTSQITTSYSSRFDSTEFNFVRPYANIQFLAGFRYIELNDKYDINGASSAFSASDYLIQSHNHLYGTQVGARGQWQISRVTFDIQSKAGVYANSAAQHQTVYDGDNTFLFRDAGASNTELSFVGEVSAYLTVPVYSFLTARFGYSALWVTDLALAPNQLDFSNDATSGTALNAHAGIIIHGFDAGLEARW